MDRLESLRWLGSVGIFYVAIPLWIVFGEPWLLRLAPGLPQAEFPIGSRVAFAVLAAGGAMLATVSMAQLVRRGGGHPFDLTGHERLSRPTRRLVTSGVYACVRNPMGLGDVLLYAGLAGAVGSLPSLLVNVPIYVVLVGWNHRMNERRGLLERFGEEWLRYEASTPWLVPRRPKRRPS